MVPQQKGLKGEMKDSTDKHDVSTIVAYVVALTVFAALTGGA